VRPDGFVAWRSPGAADRPAEALETVLRTTLGVGSRKEAPLTTTSGD